MPRPYSRDLRERVVAACEAGGKRSEIAQRFRISEATLYAWLQQWRAGGRLEARPHAGGSPSRIDLDRLERLSREKPDRTLEELAALYHKETAQRVDPSWVRRLLLRRRIVRKK